MFESIDGSLNINEHQTGLVRASSPTHNTHFFFEGEGLGVSRFRVVLGPSARESSISSLWDISRTLF